MTAPAAFHFQERTPGTCGDSLGVAARALVAQLKGEKDAVHLQITRPYRDQRKTRTRGPAEMDCVQFGRARLKFPLRGPSVALHGSDTR